MEKLLKSKVLKNLGLTDKNQWMLYDDKSQKFFEYLADNLDEDNILSPEELARIAEIEAAGNYLEGDALNEELKKLESSFPGILTITDESTEEVERELEFFQNELKEREERIARMEETKKQQLKKLERLDRQQTDLKYQEKLLTEQCLKKAQVLQDLQRTNQEKISELKQSYIQPSNQPRFMYQMPLEQHFHKCDQFLTQLEGFIRKHFNITNSLDETDDEAHPSAEVVELKARINEVEMRRFENDLTLAGISEIVKNVSNIKNRASSDSHEMRTMVEEIEIENEHLELQFEVVRKEALMLLEQSVEHDVGKFLNEHFQQKNKRAFDRLNMLNSVGHMVESVVMLCEMLWIVMQLDLERLKKLPENSEDFNNQVQESLKRTRIMKLIQNRDPDEKLKSIFLNELQDVLIENLNVERNEIATIADCLQMFLRFDGNLCNMIKSSVAQEYLSDERQHIQQIERQSELLRDLIYDGPTKRPVLYDTKFSMEIHEHEQRTKQLSKSFDTAKFNYKSKIVEPCENDKFFRMERNLWIYFLTEPKRVLDCIKEVKKKAAEHGTVAFKAINIQLPKAT